MADINHPHPIIAHGELYVEPITRKTGPMNKKFPHEYTDAKKKIISDLAGITESIENKSEIFLNEKIICIRMETSFEAKSYVPNSLILTKNNMEIVGGRKYTLESEDGKEQKAKLYFMKTNNAGIKQLQDALVKGTKDNVKNWREQISSIHSIDLLTASEKIMGLDASWKDGIIEVVLHPLEYEQEEMIRLFYKTLGIAQEQTAIRSYDDGLTFISAKCSREDIEKIRKFNPLRALHPIGRISIEQLRGTPIFDAPQLPPAKIKSQIRIGVFDGGADDNLPLLKGYTKSYDEVKSNAKLEYRAHATAVCGAALHGNLATKTKSDILPTPTVSVDSFRVLPIQESDDFESALGLYEAIDAIERVVKKRKDIKVFNLSFGPSGAIFDDSISRFTYTLDRLTYDVEESELNPLFCVAVGNDGDLIEPLNRIQAPADMVNGLGVGAYSYNSSGEKIRALYSCIGSGREGAKIKPDFLEFGGSKERPFVLVGDVANTTNLSCGTSFASPITAGKIGKLMARSENITPHIGRVLLIHNASNSTGKSTVDEGYGFCIEDIEQALKCSDKEATILYAGSLIASNTVKLPIFSPSINKTDGKVRISWTIATIVDPCVNDPDAYTNNCIEDSFVPHDLTFKFTKKGNKDITLNLAKPSDSAKAELLVNQGYIRSYSPVTKPANKNLSELELRMTDLKWDTVIKKEKSMMCSSLLNPYLTLHAIGRNGYEARELKYFVTVTVAVPKYIGSLYDAILQNYPQLTPIALRATNRIMVPIE